MTRGMAEGPLFRNADRLRMDAASSRPASSVTPRGVVQVIGESGESVSMPIEKYLGEVFPNQLQAAWETPDTLHDLIATAQAAGLYAECIGAVRQLMRIDPDPERSHAVAGVVLTLAGQYDQAEAVFERYLRRWSGDSARILTSLAHLHVMRGDRHRAMDVFWKALKVDPENAQAVAGYAHLQQALGGEAGYVVALRRVAQAGSQVASGWLLQHRAGGAAEVAGT